MDVYNYIRELKKRGVIKVKQGIVIENVMIYVSDETVYKIAIHINPDMIKKAKRLGLNNEWTIVRMNDKIQMEDKYKNGKFLIIYDLSKDSADVYDGEVSEMDQVKKLKGE